LRQINYGPGLMRCYQKGGRRYNLAKILGNVTAGLTVRCGAAFQDHPPSGQPPKTGFGLALDKAVVDHERRLAPIINAEARPLRAVGGQEGA
jgi:hypothetical protein